MRVTLKNITKAYGANRANDSISLDFAGGEIHALVGENGAGKSTLVKILAGMHQQDTGEILLDCQPVRIDSPRRALEAGIALVSQHSVVAPRLTVFENILVTCTRWKSGVLRHSDYRVQIQEVMARCGFHLDLDAPVEALGLSAQKQIEVVRALLGEARVLIFDEPTDVLSPAESERFFVLLRGLAAEGCTVILITHFLSDALAHSSTVTVLRKGRVIASLRSAETSAVDLAEQMVGALPKVQRPSKPHHGGSSRPIVRVDNVSILNQGRQVVSEVSFDVGAGEVLGVAGVAGNGQEELVEALVGLRAMSTGRIMIDGTEVVAGQTRHLIRSDRVGYVPLDRGRDGLAYLMTVCDNLCFEVVERPQVCRYGLRLLNATRVRAAGLVRRFNIQPPEITRLAGMLSGGNQQKLVVSRVLDRQPRLLVVGNPSRGLDVGAARWVWENIRIASEAGSAVVLLSNDLDEIRMLSHRIIVFFRGRISGQVDPETATPAVLGMLMGGGQVSHAA